MLFCTCGSITQDGICTNKRCDSRNLALLSWIINGKLERFKRPVTLAEAIEAVKDKSEIVYKIKAPKDEYVKMPTW